MLTEIIRERIEEIKADITEFTILGIEATSEKDKMRYGYLVAEFKDTLKMTQCALKKSEAGDKKREEINRMMTDDTSDFGDIMNALMDVAKGNY